MNTKKLFLHTALISILAAVTSCGGGGNSAPNNTPAAGMLISGVVAAGAPLAGFVAIKDSTGTIVTTAIGSNGNYTVDVENLTPPFVLFASGIAAGQAYNIASAATLDDIGGVVNITPLTDLIVGNVAGTDSAEFFNNPNFTVLTNAALDSAETDLRARLEPMLTEAGIAANFNLLNTTFSANHNGLDGLLDVLDVVVDPNTETATITYALDDTVKIEEDLTLDTDITTIDVSAVDVAAAVDANTEIAQVLSNFVALYASGTPTANDVNPFIHGAFLHDGSDNTAFIAFLTSTNTTDQEKVTVFTEQVANYAILDMMITTTSTMTIKYGDGEEMLMIDMQDGAGWKMLGNQRSWGSSVFTETFFDPATEPAANITASSVSFNVAEDFGAWTNQNYLVATGPGLPANGVVLIQYALNKALGSESVGDIDARFVVSDTDIATINNGAIYTLKLYNDVNGDTNIYPTNGLATLTDAGTLTGTGDDTLVDTHTDILAVRPLLTTETNMLAAITAPAPADIDPNIGFTAGTLDVTWTLPTGASSHEVIFDRYSDLGYERVVQKSVSDTATSVTLTVPAVNLQWIELQSVAVITRDEFNRVFSSEIFPWIPQF